MMLLVWVALAMFAKDGFATLLVVAEAKGRAVLAGVLDASYDLANILTMVFGAGEIILHGWGAQSLEVLGVMMLTSLIGTAFWTKVGRRIHASVI